MLDLGVAGISQHLLLSENPGLLTVHNNRPNQARNERASCYQSAVIPSLAQPVTEKYATGGGDDSGWDSHQ